MDGGRLWPSHDIQRDGLMRIAPEAADFEVSQVLRSARCWNVRSIVISITAAISIRCWAVSGIECIAQRGGRLSWSPVAEHALIPRLARESIRLLACFSRALSRSPDRAAVNLLS
jgi:hypothetical protein